MNADGKERGILFRSWNQIDPSLKRATKDERDGRLETRHIGKNGILRNDHFNICRGQGVHDR